MRKIELRDFRWAVDRPKAILGIKKEQRDSMKVAKDTYEKLDKFVQESLYVIEIPEEFSAHDEHYLMMSLLSSGILNYTEYDVEAEKEQKIYELRKNKEKEALKWLEQQSPETKRMVKILMGSTYSIMAIGG